MTNETEIYWCRKCEAETLATKEVSDNLGKGGEKLAEIKRAIYDAARETKWKAGKMNSEVKKYE